MQSSPPSPFWASGASRAMELQGSQFQCLRPMGVLGVWWESYPVAFEFKVLTC